jgi:hypothetical protein
LKDGKLVANNSKRRPSGNDDLVETIRETGFLSAQMFCRIWFIEDVFKGAKRMMLFLGFKLELLHTIKLGSRNMRHGFATLLCYRFILYYGTEIVYVVHLVQRIRIEVWLNVVPYACVCI